jgi:hypothetical protein
MTDFDQELAQLRAELVTPDAEATRRVGARLSRSIGTLAVGSVPSMPRALAWARPLQLVASFVVGGVVGAGLYSALRAPKLERVYVERPPAPVQVPVVGALPATRPPEMAPSAAPPFAFARSAALTPTASAAGDRLASLAEQQALLDVARAAFASSDYPATLKTLAAHSARFPKSVLAEEREGLQIKALAASGRVPEARALAARFQARHPQSLLLPSIKDSVGAIP